MAQLHNLTGLVPVGTATNFATLFQGLNDITNGFLGLGIVIIFTMVMFLVLRFNTDTKDAFAAATFGGLLVSFVVSALGIIHPAVPMFFALACSGTIVSYFYKRSS